MPPSPLGRHNIKLLEEIKGKDGVKKVDKGLTEVGWLVTVVRASHVLDDPAAQFCQCYE